MSAPVDAAERHDRRRVRSALVLGAIVGAVLALIAAARPKVVR